MSDIFVSYSRTDASRVAGLVRCLEGQGWSVFWDQNIPTGQNWRPYLEKSLNEARCVLVVWSSTSVASWMVREETEYARHRHLPIVPVLLDSVEPPLGFREIQAADLAGWDGRDTFPRFLKLLKDLAAILGSTGPMPVPAVARGHETNRDEGWHGRSGALPSACLRTLTGHGGAVNALAFHPDSRLLASGGADRTIKIWYLESGEVQTFVGHAGPVRAVAFSPDGRVIASGSQDGTARIWEVRTGHVQHDVTHKYGVRSIGLSPDGRLIALGSSERGIVKLCMSDGGGEVREMKQGGWACAVHSVAFSPDGRTLASGGGGDAAVRLWG